MLANLRGRRVLRRLLAALVGGCSSTTTIGDIIYVLMDFIGLILSLPTISLKTESYSESDEYRS